MRIGVGLPTAVPDNGSLDVAAYATAAERLGFHSVGVVDRLAHRTSDPLVALAVAAAATERIELTTAVLLAPLRPPRLLAKQLAALRQAAGDRLVVGLGVGSRADDYEAAGAPFHRRGALLDEIVTLLLVGQGEPHSVPALPIERLRLGAATEPALRRVARLGCAWMYGGPDVAGFRRSSADLTRYWTEHGSAGEPRRSALSFVSLGDNAEVAAERHLGTYYAYAPFKQQLIDNVPTTPAAVRDKVDGFRDADCDELVLFPCTTSPVELDRLAEAVIA